LTDHQYAGIAAFLLARHAGVKMDYRVKLGNDEIVSETSQNCHARA
jgi:hypothetical protein